MISIKKIMKSDFSKISSLDSIEAAVESMKKTNIDYLIVEEGDEIKGVITSNKLVGYPSTRLILDCVIEPIGVILEEDLLDKALNILEEKKVNFLAILNKEKVPVGIINQEVILSFLCQELKKSNKEKELLLYEIHHRCKNNMQVVSSLLRLQSRTIEDKEAVDIFKESQSRIKSMALIHEKFYQSQDLVNIDFKEYIEELANSLISSYSLDESKIAIDIDVEDISLGLGMAIPCGLLINELISNSLKHAFPATADRPEGKKGEIKVSLQEIGENDIELKVSDNGIGIPQGLDFRKSESLGLQLVTTLVEDQLEGEIDLDRTAGTEFKIRFKKMSSEARTYVQAKEFE